MKEKISSQEIFLRFRGILIERLGVDKEEITLETNLKDDLNVDSLDQVEIMMDTEDEFGIGFNDNEFEDVILKTVQDVVNLIEKRNED
jgi:acyl carrier protein